MIELKGTPKEQRVRQWLNDNMGGEISMTTKVIDVFRRFEIDCPDISYGCLNSTIKKAIAEGNGTDSGLSHICSVVTPRNNEPVEVKIVDIESMDFPDFKRHRTGKYVDELMSDHEEGGGVYGGTVNIVIGESGSGKSTVLLDVLASIKEENPDVKMLYVSSEMTKNDLLFYYRKTPAIAKVPTLLLMDYVKDGTINRVMEQVFNDEYDIIVLDSYQDVVVKIKECLNWKSTFAEGWLTNMMIDAAENNGTAIFAIQHLTKGGQYVGSTYLKHATTAMLELRFDDAGLRYLMFSKNRRGGSMTDKRLYFSLNEEGNVVYDKDRFIETEDLRKIENTETIRQVDLSKKFDDMFMKSGSGETTEHKGSDDAPELYVEPEIENEEEMSVEDQMLQQDIDQMIQMGR